MDRSTLLKGTEFSRIRAYSIDSRNRTRQEDSTTEFKIDLGSFDGGIKSATLISAEIPNTEYVFTSDNNVITFNEGGGNLTATITPGTYNISDLISEIDTRLNAAGALTYTTTFSDITKKITLSATGNFNVLWTFTDDNPASLLGFTVDLGGSSSYTAPNSINIAGENSYFIAMRDLNLTGTLGGQNMIGYTYKVPINVGYGDVCFYSSETGLLQPFRQDNNRFLQPIMFIQLLKYDGSVVDLQGADWSFTVLIETYRSTA